VSVSASCVEIKSFNITNRHPVEGRGWALPHKTKPNPGLRRDDDLRPVIPYYCSVRFKAINNTLKFLGLAFFVNVSIGTAYAADKLTAAEIRKLLTGTYNVSVADSVTAIAVFSPGGGISVVTNKGEKDTGRWSFSGNKVCVQFKHLLDHKSNCSSLVNDGGAIRGNGFTARR
jgi:hypothetical protein